MKYFYTQKTANLECCMNHTPYKADSVPKRCKTIIFCENFSGRFLTIH